MDIMEALANKDERPKKGGWAPGEYTAVCLDCGVSFIGDKRAIECARCAHKNTKKVNHV